MRLEVEDLIKLFKVTYPGTYASFACDGQLNEGNFNRFLCGHRGYPAASYLIRLYLVERYCEEELVDENRVFDSTIAKDLVMEYMTKTPIEYLIFLDADFDFTKISHHRQIIESRREESLMIYCLRKRQLPHKRETIGWIGTPWFLAVESEKDSSLSRDVMVAFVASFLGTQCNETVKFILISDSKSFEELSTQLEKVHRRTSLVNEKCVFSTL